MLRSTIKTEHREVGTTVTKPYPHRLNLLVSEFILNFNTTKWSANSYDRPPLYDVTLEEFETCAIDRLRVLAEIESSFVRNRSWDELKAVTTAQSDKYLPLKTDTAKSSETEYERRRDHLGHFVLRLAFCRSEDLRRRFVKAETTLFRVRYETEGHAQRTNFLESRKFGWLEVSDDEKKEYIEQIRIASSLKQHEIDQPFVKVKFTRVLDLVEKRRVFLRGGWAYVPERERSSIVFNEFEKYLMKALELTSKALPRLDEDSRLVPILSNLSQGFLAGAPSEWAGASNATDAEGITADMIDELAQKHFPLCMRNLHRELRATDHLKHFGRLQYGLFLKVLGLPIEEAIAFWRKSFMRRITEDKFNKEYKYNIRHSYGLEGKRANYAAKRFTLFSRICFIDSTTQRLVSCQQILLSDQPGPSDCHGCPYRHFSADSLQAALRATYPAVQGDLPEIMNTVKAGHYHVACTRVFEITHKGVGVKKGEGVGDGESVTHPNQYAARSRELEKAKLESIAAETSVAMEI
ncbi:hypothetical protein HWV62_17523 [Athelia sp. TMB]|nr:hypothetical protein HWV62_17523 [Athelia sp. TMB]